MAKSASIPVMLQFPSSMCQIPLDVVYEFLATHGFCADHTHDKLRLLRMLDCSRTHIARFSVQAMELTGPGATQRSCQTEYHALQKARAAAEMEFM